RAWRGWPDATSLRSSGEGRDPYPPSPVAARSRGRSTVSGECPWVWIPAFEMTKALGSAASTRIAARSGYRKQQLEGDALVGWQQPDRSAMAGHHGAHDRKPHAGAAGIAPGGKEGVEDLLAVRLRDRIAVIGDGHLDCVVLG